MRIENAEDAKSVARRYMLGTRSRHAKIASILMEQEAKGPDSKGMWTVKGTYVTEEGEKGQFTAFITSRGEVLMSNPASHEVSGKRPPSTQRR